MLAWQFGGRAGENGKACEAMTTLVTGARDFWAAMWRGNGGARR